MLYACNQNFYTSWKVFLTSFAFLFCERQNFLNLKIIQKNTFCRHFIEVQPIDDETNDEKDKERKKDEKDKEDKKRQQIFNNNVDLLLKVDLCKNKLRYLFEAEKKLEKRANEGVDGLTMVV